MRLQNKLCHRCRACLSVRSTKTRLVVGSTGRLARSRPLNVAAAVGVLHILPARLAVRAYKEQFAGNRADEASSSVIEVIGSHILIA